jgi:hypothetical protein
MKVRDNLRVAAVPATPASARHAIAFALLIALAPWPHAARAQNATPTGPAAVSTGAPQKDASSTDWIEFDDGTYTPVVDDVSTNLAAARLALVARENDMAATSLEAAGRALQAQAERVGALERQRRAVDMKLARETQARMSMLAKRLDATAQRIRAGKLVSIAQFDRTIDKAARADLERRWLVSDVTVWYPVTEDPQRHLASADAFFARKEFRAAAAEVRRAASYLRLESARAVGEARSGLDAADAALDRTASALDRGRTVSEQTLHRVFAQADHALAVAHRAKAAEAWSRKGYEKSGYELKAAAHGLVSAAGWAGDKARAAAAAAGAEAHALGDKLVSGGVWTRDEVAHGFESLGGALDHVGRAIGIKARAVPFDTGA